MRERIDLYIRYSYEGIIYKTVKTKRHKNTTITHFALRFNMWGYQIIEIVAIVASYIFSQRNL